MELLPVELLDEAVAFGLEEVYVAELRATTPKDTRETSKHWYLRKIGLLHYEIFNDIIVGNKYSLALILDQGIDPQIIKAKNRKFLRFEKPTKKRASPYKHIPGNVAFEKDGYIFAKMVRHPGFKGRYYIQRTLDSPALMQRFERAVMVYVQSRLKL